MSNFQSSSDKNQEFVNVSKNPMYQHLSNADLDPKLIHDTDNVHKSPVKKQSLLCSENSNNLIDSIKMSTYQDCTSKNIVKQIVSKNISKTKNLTILDKVRSRLNTYNRSYVCDNLDLEVNPDASYISHSPNNSLFMEVCPAECNSDSSETVRSESNIKENDKECKRIASSNKEISGNTSIDKKITLLMFITCT